jgi:pimeloyl-ACP methyl ester carboxylesterase
METTFRFSSYDGTSLEGTLSGAAAPSEDVVLLVHGITSSRDEFGLFSGLAHHLANVGISSLRFDYRCHGANEQSLESLTLSGVVNDIEAAAQVALEKSGAKRIHIVGMSFGGGLSAFWGAATTRPVASVVMFAPVIDYEQDVLGQYDLLAGGTLTAQAARQLAKQGYLDPDGNHYGTALINELRYISGIRGLRQLRCSSLILHGDADSVVPYASSEKYCGLNPNCRLVNIPGTDHGFGVEDDEDLSSPETKAQHQKVFEIVTAFVQATR